jgi:predicted phosphate transport protein (TIGR00153 family)
MPPTNPLFSNLFGHSPFKPMQEHMRVAVSCAAEVVPLMEALTRGDQDAVAKVKERVFEIEDQADQLKNELRSRLPKGLFMPVDRRDLLELLHMQDSIADTAQDIAGLLVERTMEVPEVMAEPVMDLVKVSVETCQHSLRVIEELDELVEMGFRGQQADKVEDMINALNRAEDDSDAKGMALTRVLFANEDQMKPVSVMFWYQLIQWIGDLADYGEKVGDRVRLLIAR